MNDELMFAIDDLHVPTTPRPSAESSPRRSNDSTPPRRRAHSSPRYELAEQRFNAASGSWTLVYERRADQNRAQSCQSNASPPAARA